MNENKCMYCHHNEYEVMAYIRFCPMCGEDLTK